jgi:hypothetical protein
LRFIVKNGSSEEFVGKNHCDFAVRRDICKNLSVGLSTAELCAI